MKRIIAVFLSLLICISFSACGKTPNAETYASAIGENTGTTDNVSEYLEEKNDGVSENSGETIANEDTKTHGSNGDGKGNAETQKSSSKTEISTAPTVISTEFTTEPSSKITCTVQVECKKILSKKNKFKKDISLVPSDGVILSPVKVYLDEGATAYDALQKACSQNSIALNAQNSAFGIYIVGIGGIEEKDCGAQSGWVYTVNGKSPSAGLGNYKIKNGDSMVLSYVC